MLVHTLQKTQVTRPLGLQLGSIRANRIISNIEPYLNGGDRILDIGSGSCTITKTLRRQGFETIPLDIENLSIYEDLPAVIYDGSNIPFGNKEFSVALLITVLHHINEPEVVLREALRVAKRVIVVEDIYSTIWRKYLTYFLDSCVNLEFKDHPRSNRTDREWQETFLRLGTEVRDVQHGDFYGLFEQATYYLDTNGHAKNFKP